MTLHCMLARVQPAGPCHLFFPQPAVMTPGQHLHRCRMPPPQTAVKQLQLGMQVAGNSLRCNRLHSVRILPCTCGSSTQCSSTQGSRCRCTACSGGSELDEHSKDPCDELVPCKQQPSSVDNTLNMLQRCRGHAARPYEISMLSLSLLRPLTATQLPPLASKPPVHPMQWHSEADE